MMDTITLEDFSRICRSCLCKTDEMRPIFGSSLDNMFRDVTDIAVKNDDGLPESMCISCVLQVSRSYTFRQKCRRSDETLQSLLNEGKLTTCCISEIKAINIEEIEATFMHGQNERNESNSNSILPPNLIEQTDDLNLPVQINQTVPSKATDDELSSLQEIVIEDKTIEQTLNDIEEHEMHSDDQKSHVKETIFVALISSTDATSELVSSKIIAGHHLESQADSINSTKTIAPNETDESTIDNSESVTKSKFKCPECHKCFAENKILKRHLKIHNPNKPHVCNACGMSFAESSNLSKHMKKHTGELRNVVGKPNLCSVCGKGFKWASSLSKHMKHHTRRKILNCPYCPKYYVEARSLNIHLRSHTGEKPFVCETCNKGFTQMGNLEKHLRVHTGEKPYSCPICHKGFSQSGYVAIHLRTHTGEKPYICDNCGKAFAGSNTLAIHKRIHTGERPYPCGVCDKTFARQETAIIHQRTHTGERPFTCNLCSRGFTSSGHLTGHMRSHNGIKTHECKVCQRRFAGSSSLKVHMRTHVEKNLQEQQQQQPLRQTLNDKNAIFQCDMCKMNIPSTMLTTPTELQAYNHEFIDDVLICANVSSIIDNDKVIEEIQNENGTSIVLANPNDSDAEQEILINLTDLK